MAFSINQYNDLYHRDKYEMERMMRMQEAMLGVGQKQAAPPPPPPEPDLTLLLLEDL